MVFNLQLFCFSLLFAIVVPFEADECQFLTMCKCTNFPLFTLIDTSYLSKPRSILNQDLFCTYSSEFINENKLTTFDQFKYFYYRFRTLTFANYPLIPSKAFRFVHFEIQSVKQTPKSNNRNVIAFVQVEQTQSGIFDELSLPDAHEQLMISFLNSPSLVYVQGGLSTVNCYELKFYRTNPNLPLDFFFGVQSIHQLIIDNPSFTGFIASAENVSFSLTKLFIKDISVRHLQGKHFPMVLPTLKELTLENNFVDAGFRSLNSQQLAKSFPNLRSLMIYSRSMQRLTRRMFEYFDQLEYLKVRGIKTVENEAFYNLHQLRELHLGQDVRRLDPFAFLHMTTKYLFLNESQNYKLNDDNDFCVFVQFSPLSSTTTFVQFSSDLPTCSCTIRYLYRHLDKSLMHMTPRCYSNSSLYILGQEERLCYFEERLLQCHVLPDDGITIYGKHYNVSYFYQQQTFKHQQQPWALLYKYRFYILASSIVLIVGIIFIFSFVRRDKDLHTRSYQHLNRLLKRRSQSNRDQVTMDIIYHRADVLPDRPMSTVPTSTKL